nr:hypothetical protein [Tanacetum cinerariifolium]
LAIVLQALEVFHYFHRGARANGEVDEFVLGSRPGGIFQLPKLVVGGGRAQLIEVVAQGFELLLVALDKLAQGRGSGHGALVVRHGGAFGLAFAQGLGLGHGLVAGRAEQGLGAVGQLALAQQALIGRGGHAGAAFLGGGHALALDVVFETLEKVVVGRPELGPELGSLFFGQVSVDFAPSVLQQLELARGLLKLVGVFQ